MIAETLQLPESGGLNTEQLTQNYQLTIWQTLVLGGEAYWRLFTRGRRDTIGIVEGMARAYQGAQDWPEVLSYPLEGLQFAESLKRSDRAVNNFTYLFYRHTESGHLAFRAMEDPAKPDHGWPHNRRVEEWIEADLLHDKTVRHEQGLPYKFWLPALHLSARYHDALQQINGKKDWHSQLAAIFMLASYDLVSQAFGVSQEEAWLYCRGAALLILPHSKPELLVSRYSELPYDSPKDLFNQIEFKADFNQLMPKEFRQDFKDKFALLRQDKRQLAEGMSRNDLIVLRRLARSLGIGDKAESVYPGALATLRTFLSDKPRQRPLYMGNEQLTIDGEFDQLVIDGFVDKFNSDVHRKIFELVRDLPLANNPWMAGVIDRNTLAGMVESKRIFTSLMRGNVYIIDEVFSQRTESLRQKVASRKHNGPLEQKLKQQLAALDQEKQALLEALGWGHKSGKVRAYSQAEIDRAEKLFDYALERTMLAQDKPLGYPIPSEWLPYKHYDSISLPDEMRRGKLTIRG